MILQLSEIWEAVQVFLETGGDVLLAIAAVTLVMWALIAERFLFFTFRWPWEVKQARAAWQAREDRSSWYAEQIRRLQISELSLKLNTNLTMIKTLVAVCPLLGLLGTVTGMIELFDVMAIVGSGNTRAMASGVYLATVPTMSGMVAALSGVYFSARLERRAKAKVAKAEEQLSLERGPSCAVAA